MKDEENGADAGAFAGIGDLSGFFAPAWAKDEEKGTVRVVGGFQQRESEGSGGRDRREGTRGVLRERGSNDRRNNARRDSGERRAREGRDAEERGNALRTHNAGQERREPQKPLPLMVRFLPDGKALDAIIKRIQTTRKAYPFRDIIKLFRGDDSSLAIRIEVDRAQDSALRLRQCRTCSFAALSDEEMLAHLIEKHLGEYFEARDVEVEPPKGNFPCVARCGLTGDLLGPPNHHTFSAKIQEMLTSRFPNMSEAEYRSHLEMVKDSETIEQWRDAARHQVLYFRKKADKAAQSDDKTAKDAEPQQADGVSAGEEPVAQSGSNEEQLGITRKEAEAIFRSEIAPGLAVAASHVICQAKVLKKMPNRRLASLLNREFERDGEMRNQGSLARAVHAAFNHRGLHFFRVDDERGPEFVAAVSPSKLDTTNVTEEIRSIVTFVEANPGSQSKKVAEALSGAGGEEVAKRLTASLRWLIDKGHIVEYYNGVLAIGEPHPLFAMKPKKAAQEAGATSAAAASKEEAVEVHANSEAVSAAVEAPAAVEASAEVGSPEVAEPSKIEAVPAAGAQAENGADDAKSDVEVAQ